MTEADDIYPSLVANCVLNAFLSYTAIMLNTVTILALRKTSSLPKPLKTLLLSLAVSDLGVGLVVQPLYIAKLVMEMKQNNKNSETYANVDKAFVRIRRVLFHASFFGVTALCADRFLAIHLHLRYQELVTHKRVVAVVILIWILSAFLPLLPFWIPMNVITFIVQTIQAVCYISTAFFYYKIYVTVRRHANQIQTLQVQEFVPNVETAISNFARLHRKSAVGTFYVYLVFVACYLPITFVWVAKKSCRQSSLLSHVHLFTLTLIYLNSSLNPVIYCLKMRHIRHAIINILRNIFPSRN